MEPAGGIEPSSVAYQATARPLSYTGTLTNWIPAADLNRALLITKQVRRHLRLQGTHWSLVPESNWVPRDTNPAHRRQCLRGETSAGVLPLDDTPEGAPGFEPGFPAAWSGIPDSNWCMQTGSLPS